MFVKNKYYRWYRSITKTSDTGPDVERHHIVPRCMGGGEGKNIVALSYRKHFLAHWLLTKCTRGEAKRKMFKALKAMSMDKFGTRLLSSWQFEVTRKAGSVALIGNKHTLGYKHDDVAKRKISAASSSRVRSEETKRKTAEAVKASWAIRRANGWKHSPATIAYCTLVGRRGYA